MVIREKEPMASHTTFRVGGPALYYLIPEDSSEIGDALGFAQERELPFMIVGNGSNLLFSDSGYQGVVIEIGENIAELTIASQGRVCVGAGMRLSVMAGRLAAEGLAGFEFAAGIPGTVGGAVTMNAGAYGGEIGDCLKEVTVMSPGGERMTLGADELELSYRHSILQDGELIVLDGTFEFESGDPDEIREKIKELNSKRREKQPLDFPSAGSTFKRPEGYFAGKLIEDAGLRGFSIGGAMVSDKHCGFIVNKGEATADDIFSLIEHVRRIVKETSGVELEPEVKLIGDFTK
ncbi:MAG: UDP-N-acetylmuramate dehydrogenase [Eubacterium sp.]|nr:UDP-N-acetylmuramate dehydrogenase [Eubacterium sp.]